MRGFGVADQKCNTSCLFIKCLLYGGQRLAGSLAGVAPSENVSEGPNGKLIIVGNYEKSVEANACLTVARTEIAADAKAGLSDPTSGFSDCRV